MKNDETDGLDKRRYIRKGIIPVRIAGIQEAGKAYGLSFMILGIRFFNF